MSEGVGSHFKENNTTFFIAYECVCMHIFFTVIILIAIELCIPIHICTYVCMYRIAGFFRGGKFSRI